MSAFRVKVRDKLNGSTSTYSISCPGMTPEQCKKQVEDHPGPGGSKPRNEVLEIVQTAPAWPSEGEMAEKTVFTASDSAVAAVVAPPAQPKP